MQSHKGHEATRSGRLAELDGLRGCAILLVLMYHYVVCQLGAPEPRTFTSRLSAALSLSYSGVDLFFVLSGFLITGILLDNRSANNYFRVFYIRRVCRIFPLYYLMVGLFAILILAGLDQVPAFSWLLGKPMPLWSQLSFTQNIVMGVEGHLGAHWLGPTWSLAIEEQFYCLMPLLVWLLPRRFFVLVAVVLVCVAVLLRVTCGGWHSYVWTPWRGDAVLTGACIALAVRNRAILRLLRASVPVLYGGFFIFLSGAALMTVSPSAFGAANYTLLAGLYGVFLLLAVVEPKTLVARVLRNRVLVWLGMTSYGIYMFHEAVTGLVHCLIRQGSPSIGTALGCVATLVSLGLTLILAAASYRLFERPFLAWGHGLKYRQAGGGGQEARVEGRENFPPAYPTESASGELHGAAVMSAGVGGFGLSPVVNPAAGKRI
jgi:peptidoglycan/LPS O-acetylase OafA/YrhL